jgi:hypothetical protein
MKRAMENGKPLLSPCSGELVFAANIRFPRRNMAANTSSPLHRRGGERTSGAWALATGRAAIIHTPSTILAQPRMLWLNMD